MSSRGRRLLDMHRSRRRGATPKDALLSILNDRGLADARIGLQTESLPSNAKEAISRALPRASIKDCTNLIRLIRMVKTGEEIARLGRAAEISEQAGLESLSLARPGRPVADLVQSYRARVAESGADLRPLYIRVRGSWHSRRIGLCAQGGRHPLRGLWLYLSVLLLGYWNHAGDAGTLRGTVSETYRNP